jgi:hypothetical protein
MGLPFAARCTHRRGQAAIHIYRHEPVAEYVWDWRPAPAGLTAYASNWASPLRVGPPFRMALAFNEPDVERLRLKRTLCQQNCSKRGNHL